MTRLATTARWSDDDLVMPARVTIALFALVAALPGAHHPVRPATSAQSSAAQCPAYATLGTNGQPAVPLARVGAERLAPLETPTDLVVCRYRGTTVLQLTGSSLPPASSDQRSRKFVSNASNRSRYCSSKRMRRYRSRTVL